MSNDGDESNINNGISFLILICFVKKKKNNGINSLCHWMCLCEIIKSYNKIKRG